MNENLIMIRKLLSEKSDDDCSLCEMIKKLKAKNDISKIRNDFILTGNTQAEKRLQEYYNVVKEQNDNISKVFLDNIIYENKIILLEEMFFGKIFKKIFDYAKSFRIRSKILENKVSKYIDTKKVRRNIEKITTPRAKKIMNSLQKGKTNAAQENVKFLSIELSEYLKELKDTFRRSDILRAVLYYLAIYFVVTTVHIVLSFIFTFPFLLEIPLDLIGKYIPYMNFVEKLDFPLALAHFIAYLLVNPFLQEKVKGEEIKAKTAGPFILVFSLGDVLTSRIQYSAIFNIIFKIFRIIVHFGGGFIHYYYQKYGRPGLGRFLATLLNSLFSITILIPGVTYIGGSLYETIATTVEETFKKCSKYYGSVEKESGDLNEKSAESEPTSDPEQSQQNT